MNDEIEQLQIRVYGDPGLPTLIYLPGLHGDWTLVTSFRMAVANRVRFVEVIYPRLLTWSLDDYTDQVVAALLAKGINRGWLLAESWGSQLAWKLLERETATKQRHITVEGLVLAGGFVKHPLKWGPAALRWIGKHTSMKSYRAQLRVYEWYAKFRHRHAPETQASIKEFIERRTELDRMAMRHRLELLDHYDPRATARQTRQPVHYLAGSVDPLVPWPVVRWWLRRNCPGYRGGKTFWLADHNVLATSPRRAADLTIKWMKEMTNNE